MFNQSFELHDLATIAVLVVLEAVLSIDNALVLGLLAKRLPKSQRAKALTLGLVGAFFFRFVSIATAQWLLKYTIVKLLGGGYLFYVAAKYFWDVLSKKKEEEANSDAANTAEPDGGELAESDSETGTGELASRSNGPRHAGFWSTVAIIELTDIAFAVDSIVAAIGLVGPAPDSQWHPKLWVVVLGGMLGVMLMRYAATVFIHLLEMFPRFETAAYLLVAVIGGKLCLDWAVNTPEYHRLDFHDYRSPAFWTFWLLMLLCFCVGFIPKKKKTDHKEVSEKTGNHETR